MNRIVHVLIGDLPTVADVAIKTSALFLTAAGLPRQRLTVDIHCVTTWSKLDTVGMIGLFTVENMR